MKEIYSLFNQKYQLLHLMMKERFYALVQLKKLQKS